MALNWNQIQGRTNNINTNNAQSSGSKINWDKIQNRGEYSKESQAKNTYKTLMNATSTKSYDEAVKANQPIGTYPQNLKEDNKVITEAKQQLYNTLNNATSTRSHDEALKQSQPLPFTNKSGVLNPFELSKGIQQKVKEGQVDSLIGPEARKTMQERIDYNGYGLPAGYNKNDVEAYKILSGKNEDEIRKEIISELTGKNQTSILKTPEIMENNLRRFEDGYNFGDITKTGLETLGETALTVGGTVGDVGLNVAKGVLSVPENMAKAGASLVAGTADLFGADEWANQIRRNVATKNIFTCPTQKAIDVIDKASIAGPAIDTVASGVGQVGGTVATTAALNTIGAGNIGFMPTTAVLQGMGTGATEAYQKTDASVGLENMTWKEKLQNALKIGGSGALAGTAEGVFGMFGVGGTPLTTKLSNTLVSKATTPLAKVLTKMGFSGLGESAEEFVEYIGNVGLNNIINKIGATDYSTQLSGEEIGKEMLTSFIIASLTQGGSVSLQMNSIAKQEISRIENELGRNLNQNEIEQVANNIADQLLIESEKTDAPQSSQIEQTQPTNEIIPSVQQNQNTMNVAKPKIYKGFHGTDSEFNEYSFDNFGKHDQGDFGKAIYFSTNKNTAQKYGKNIKESDMEISNPLILDTENDYIKMWGEVVKSIDNQQMTEIMNNLDEVEIKLLNDEYTPQQDKNFLLYNKLTADEKANLLQKLGYDGVVDNIYNQIAIFDLDRLNKKQVGEQYSLAEQSSVRRSAKNIIQKGWKIQDSTIESLESIQNKRQGLTIEFDDSIKGNGVYTVNEDGSRNIKINPNSERAIEFTVTHELAHDLKAGDEKSYKELQNFVLKYAQGFKDYNSAVKALGETYAKQLGEGNFVLNDEATNDIIAQAIGNQNFLNSLAQEQPNIFMRAYNWVKNVLFDGSKSGLTLNERKFLNNLQSKFRVAYNQTYDGNATSQENYSIGGQVGVQNAINNDKRFTKLQDNLSMAQTMAEQNIDNEYIRQKTNWFQDKNGDWKFEFPDKFMSLKSNIGLRENNTYKLSDILEHDILFVMYPELADYEVRIENMNNVKGSFNRKNNLIKLNSNLKTNEDFQGTLIHEIQHAIQKIEGFKKGRSSKGSKLAYYNSLGEIEADDTRNRYIEELNGKLDRDLVPPESSKPNPKHSRVDNYLNNRKVFDKIKDGIYKYLKDRGVISDSIDEEVNTKNRRQNSDMVVGRRGYIEELEDSSSFSYGKKQGQWQSFLDENFDLMPNAVRSMPERIVEQQNNSIEIPDKISTVKTQSYERATTNKFIKDVLDKMQTTRFGNMNEFRNITSSIVRDIKEGNLTQDKINQYANVLYDAAIRINSNFYDDNKNIKTEARNKRIYIPEEVSGSFKDWNEFRRNNFGVLNLTTKNEGENLVSISQLYNSLNRANNQLFPDNIDDSKKQLTRISEVVKSIRKIEERASKHLEDTFGKDVRESTIYRIKEDIAGLTDGITRVDNFEKENAAKARNKQELLNTVIDIEEQKKLYKDNQDMQKEYEKMLKKELLTDRDKITLDRLVKGEIEEGDLSERVNKNAILKLYPVKKKIEENKIQLERAKKAKKAQRYEIAELLTENSSTWNDKKALGGFRYNTETAERNIYDIIPDKGEAKAIIDEYFAPIHKNEAKVIREQNKIKEQIRELNIDIKSKYECSDAIRTKILELLPEGENFTDTTLSEDALIQLYGEKIINEADIKEIGADFGKIHKAAEVFRKIYDNLFDQINDSRVRNGYTPVEFRKDYFPHFTETKPDTLLKKAASAVGIETSNQELPTDLAGQTHLFKPGTKWSANFLQRKGNKTDYSALKGMDNYLNTALDVIYHTDDIQNLRVLDDVIRYKYSEKGIQEQIDEVRDRTDIDDRQKNALLNDLYNTDTTEFSHLVTWLRGYTDNISGKKSIEDRNMEHQLGRNMYTTMKNLEGRVASNMIGMNINSALTNIIPIIQGSGEIRTKNLLKALYDVSRNAGKSDGFVNESDFLVNRRGTDRLYKTAMDKINDVSGSFMSTIDEFSSETLVRAKYYDNLDNGMSSEMAMANANEFAASVMGDRSKGATPLMFNTKNPIAKTFSMFQLEVNNQFRYLFKDIPRELADKGLKAIAGALFKVFLGSWLYGEAKEKITGQRSVFDPIDIVASSVKDFMDPDTSIGEDIYNSASKISKELPFIGGLLGGGRIPISSALPGLEDTVVATSGLITGEMDTSKALKTLGKELSKPLYYLIFPTAGGQLKKSVEGISTVSKGGEYGFDSKGDKQLKFAVDTSEMSPLQKAGTYAQAGLFGKYSLPAAQEYVNSGFKQLSANRTKGYEQAIEKGISGQTYLDINSSVKDIEPDGDKWKKNERKQKIIDIIEKYKLTEAQKAYLYNVFYKNEYEEGS